MSPNKGKEDGVFFFILVSVLLILSPFITAVTLDEELILPDGGNAESRRCDQRVTQSKPTE